MIFDTAIILVLDTAMFHCCTGASVLVNLSK